MPPPLMRVRTTAAAIKGYFRAKMLHTVNGAYPTLAGSNVLVDQFGAVQGETLPQIIVFGSEEDVDQIDVTQERRHLKLTVELWAIGKDPGVQLDVMKEQVYDLFRNDEYLGGYRNGLSERILYKHGQLHYDEKRHMSGIAWVMEWSVPYIVDNTPDPETANVTPFNWMDVVWSYSLPAFPPIDAGPTDDIQINPT